MKRTLARTWRAVRFRAGLGPERPGRWSILLAAALLLAVSFSAASGSVSIPLDEIPQIATDPGHPLHAVLLQVRLPRVAAAIQVGAALALAGLLLQTTLRNPLADAGLLGVSAGAGLAGMLLLTIWPDWAHLVPAAAFGGGLLAVSALLGVAAWSGFRLSPQSLLLAGVALQAILFAFVAVLTLVFADRAPAFVAFTVGSLAATSWREVTIVCLPLALGIVGAWSAHRVLDVLSFDEGSATSLGLSVPRARIATAALGALLAAAAVSLAGLVGFVGLLVPNALRLILGSHHRTLVPLSVLAGALLVTLADLGARTIVAPIELPVGAVLALLGGPFFLFLLFRGVDA